MVQPQREGTVWPLDSLLAHLAGRPRRETQRKTKVASEVHVQPLIVLSASPQGPTNRPAAETTLEPGIGRTCLVERSSGGPEDCEPGAGFHPSAERSPGAGIRTATPT